MTLRVNPHIPQAWFPAEMLTAAAGTIRSGRGADRGKQKPVRLTTIDAEEFAAKLKARVSLR